MAPRRLYVVGKDSKEAQLLDELLQELRTGQHDDFTIFEDGDWLLFVPRDLPDGSPPVEKPEKLVIHKRVRYAD